MPRAAFPRPAPHAGRTRPGNWCSGGLGVQTLLTVSAGPATAGSDSGPIPASGPCCLSGYLYFQCSASSAVTENGQFCYCMARPGFHWVKPGPRQQFESVAWHDGSARCDSSLKVWRGHWGHWAERSPSRKKPDGLSARAHLRVRYYVSHGVLWTCGVVLSGLSLLTSKYVSLSCDLYGLC